MGSNPAASSTQSGEAGLPHPPPSPEPHDDAYARHCTGKASGNCERSCSGFGIHPCPADLVITRVERGRINEVMRIPVPDQIRLGSSYQGPGPSLIILRCL